MTRRRAFLGGAMALGANGSNAETVPPARGFRGTAWERQKALEAKLRAAPDPLRIEQYMKRMAAEPHHAGSAAGRKVAGYALGLFNKFGFTARNAGWTDEQIVLANRSQYHIGTPSSR